MKKLLAVFVCILFIATGCTPQEPKLESVDELIIAGWGNPGVSTSQFENNSPGQMILLANVYDSLVDYAEPNTIKPMLAESFDVSEDGLTYTFKLRDDVKFHNDSAFKANDVIYTFNRYVESKFKNRYLTNYQGISSNGDYEVIVKLSSPDANFLKKVSYLLILDEETVKEIGFDNYFKQDPTKMVGTGPYKVESYQAFAETKFVYNQNYFLGEPQFKSVIIRAIPDPSTQLNALESGEIHISTNLNSTDYAYIENSSDLKLYGYKGVGSAYLNTLLFNTTSEIGSNLDMRIAISHAINAAEIMQVKTNGYGGLADNFGLIEGSTGYANTADVKPYAFDVAKAKEMVKNAGFEGKKIRILSAPYFNQEAQIVAENLRQAGLDPEIIEANDQAFWSDLYSLDYDITFYNTVNQFLDGSSLSEYLDPMANANPSGYTNEAAIALMNEAKITVDPVKRDEIFVNVLKIMKNEAIIVPLFFDGTCYASLNEVYEYPFWKAHTIERFSYIKFKRGE
jgi:peptide/nickel transport system substrate-binding protein